MKKRAERKAAKKILKGVEKEGKKEKKEKEAKERKSVSRFGEDPHTEKKVDSNPQELKVNQDKPSFDLNRLKKRIEKSYVGLRAV